MKQTVERKTNKRTCDDVANEARLRFAVQRARLEALELKLAPPRVHLEPQRHPFLDYIECARVPVVKNRQRC